MKANNKKSLAQNFIAKSHLAALLIDESSINFKDIVYEIGPGAGRLTIELSKKAKKVIAIEKDHALYAELKRKLSEHSNIIICNGDFLQYRIREFDYKIFANIPFNITSAIVRKIVDGENPPSEAYLIIQKEAAERYTGTSRTTQFSVLINPWFRLKIIKFFKRTDFSPVPNVDIVMLHMAKRARALIQKAEASVYRQFIKYGFKAWKKNLKLSYRKVFTHNQWKRLSHDLAFPFHARPSELHFGQWLGLFELYKKYAHVKKK